MQERIILQKRLDLLEGGEVELDGERPVVLVHDEALLDGFHEQ
jgi:hypothetical protein